MLYRCAVEVFSLIIKVIVQYWAATLMVLILRGALSTARDRSLPAVPIISGDHTHRHALCNTGQKCHTWAADGVPVAAAVVSIVVFVASDPYEIE